MGTEIQGTTNGSAAPAAMAVVEIAPRTGEIIKVGFETVQGFEALQRVAKSFCASSLVPESYRGPNNIANTMIAIEMAQRMGASPLMVMQHLYVVHGRPGWSGQFYIASFNRCGRFSPIRYRFTGEKGKDSWGCIAWAREVTTGEVVESAEVTIATAKSEGWHEKNPKWRSIPQHMLMLRAGAWLVRTVAPELTMGLRAAEEIEDMEGGEEFQAPPPATPIPEAGMDQPENTASAQPADELAQAQALLQGVAAEAAQPGKG